MKNMMNTNSVSVMTLPSANGIGFGINIPDNMMDGMDKRQLSLILTQVMSEVVGDMSKLADLKAVKAYGRGYEEGKQEFSDDEDDDDDWGEDWDDDDEDDDCDGDLEDVLWYLLSAD